MNIVKLKDIIMGEDYSFADFFNKKLKGKYAYWIQMRYIFPLESLDYITYVKFEQLDNDDFLQPDMPQHIDLYSTECCMHNFTNNYIDCNVTDDINTARINEYIIANNYVTDYDIDIPKLRNFRSWLAGEILTLNKCPDGTYLKYLSENQVHMLEYYKNDLYNEVVKQLSVFGKENAFNSFNGKTSCGCCATNDIMGIYNNKYYCDALETYINNVHALMVQTFENVYFWVGLNKRFILTFKKYIDNIIKTGLIINKDKNTVYIQCKCNDTGIDTTKIILNNLSDALQYIINDDIDNHLNFIHDALYNWADQLYDKMSWKIK